MRCEAESLRQKLGEASSNPVIVLGPPGCGKTYLSRMVVRDLSMEAMAEGASFGMYFGPVFEDVNPMAREGSEFSYAREVLVAKDEAELEWHTLRGLTDLPGPLQAAGGPLLGRPDLWNDDQLLEKLKSYGRRIVILDDYDVLRRRFTAATFKMLSRLKDAQVEFLLTSRGSLSGLTPPVGEEEASFLSGIVSCRAFLPREHEAKEIAREALSRHGLPSDDEAVGEAVEQAGSYPALIVHLIDASSGLSYQDRLRATKEARLRPKFRFYLEALWERISREDKKVMALLLLAEDSKRPVEEIANAWVKMDRRRRSWFLVRRALERLRTHELLVRFEEGAYSIPSRALRDLLAGSQLVRDTADELGLRLRGYRSFQIRIFLFWWLLGLSLYLVLAFSPSQGGLYRVFRLLSFVPAFWYLLMFGVVRKIVKERD